MADEFWDCTQFKKTKTGKTFGVRIGSAKKREDGTIAVYLDALPMPGPDGCQFVIAPRRQQQTGGGFGSQRPAAPKPQSDFEDDREIPF